MSERSTDNLDCHYDGDINRCDKNCKQLGECKRRTTGMRSAEVPNPLGAKSDSAQDFRQGGAQSAELPRSDEDASIRSILSVVQYDMRDAAERDLKALLTAVKAAEYTRGREDGFDAGKLSAARSATGEIDSDDLEAHNRHAEHCDYCCVIVPE